MSFRAVTTSPSRSFLEPGPQRARDHVDPDVARDVAEGEHDEQHERRHDPDRRGDPGTRQALGEPDAEHDQPERSEVEDVPVVEAVEAELGAGERGRDEQHRGVDRDECGDERGRRT